MNSYFASVEQQADPRLRGRPVGVCEHLGGIIIAPSVEAKRLGIALGTTTWDARKIYPRIVLLPTNPEKYRATTARFLQILHDYTDLVEQYSIDEAFLDASEICRNFEEALLLALEIKQRLRQEVGEWLSCSIGIGPNKLVAKIAADLDGGVIASEHEAIPRGRHGLRPRDDIHLLDRICVIKPEHIHLLYKELKLTDVPGIGKRLEIALNKLGIFSLKDLSNYPLANLLNQFGIWGQVLHELGNLQDNSEVIPREAEPPPKSVGHAYTVPKALANTADIKKLMFKLSEKVGRRMRALGARGNIVHYFHSDKRWVGFSKQRKIGEFINDGRMIYRAAYKIFKQSRHSRAGGNPVKIMGVSVSGLSFETLQEPLFEQFKRPVWLVAAMDKINEKYGDLAIRRAALSGTPDEWARDTVGFGRMRSP
ncbi:MAG: DNA polymerase IV [Candidatus Doudnabacteria bacterium]|nr:DNA polymerase IV [Candidatus Doudnabacteria bacterium]